MKFIVFHLLFMASSKLQYQFVIFEFCMKKIKFILESLLVSSIGTSYHTAFCLYILYQFSFLKMFCKFLCRFIDVVVRVVMHG